MSVICLALSKPKRELLTVSGSQQGVRGRMSRPATHMPRPYQKQALASTHLRSASVDTPQAIASLFSPPPISAFVDSLHGLGHKSNLANKNTLAA